MPMITFIQHDGSRQTVEAAVGSSVMQAAMDNLVPGILADCGGSCACATCHAYVDDGWWAKLPGPGDDESLMMEAAAHRRERSRLTCQITVTPELDGLVVRFPESQY